MCNNCRYPLQKLWAIGPPYPRWDVQQAANQVSLMRCHECGQLWVEMEYEPFGSFRYAAHWPYSGSVFEKVMNKDSGSTLWKWHEAEVRFLGNGADQKTLNHIEARYRRLRGMVNLMPFDQPNPMSIEPFLNHEATMAPPTNRPSPR